MKTFENCFDYNDHLEICLNRIEMYDFERISAGLKTLYREAKKEHSYMSYFLDKCRSLSVKYKEHHCKDVADLLHSFKRKGQKLIKSGYFLRK